MTILVIFPTFRVIFFLDQQLFSSPFFRPDIDPFFRPDIDPRVKNKSNIKFYLRLKTKWNPSSLGIPSAAGGVLLGGYLVKKFHWNCKQILKRVAIMGFFSTILTAFVLAPCYPGEENQPPTPKVNFVSLFFFFMHFFFIFFKRWSDRKQLKREKPDLCTVERNLSAPSGCFRAGDPLEIWPDFKMNIIWNTFHAQINSWGPYCWSEGSLVRRVVGPKGHWSNNQQPFGPTIASQFLLSSETGMSNFPVNVVRELYWLFFEPDTV